MFGMFNKKAKQPPLLSRQTGAGFDMDNIRKAAQLDGDWDTKETLMQGCVAAFEDGRPENLRTFIMAYLEFKRGGGAVDRIETGGLDAGFENLISKPVLHLLERQQDPSAVLDTLSREMSVYYKQIMLDIVLRHAASTNSWMVVPVLITAGADVNAGRGRPLASAGREGHVKVVQQLLQAGANIDAARTHTSAKNMDVFEKTIRAAQSAQQGKPETARAAPALSDERTIEAPRLDIAPAGRTAIKKPAGPGRGEA